MRRSGRYSHAATEIDAAPAALEADGLRELIRDLLPWFDETTQARFVTALIDCAARGASGWVPGAPTDAAVREIETFAKAVTRRCKLSCHAAPESVRADRSRGRPKSGRDAR
jgi:hypothetical protein